MATPNNLQTEIRDLQEQVTQLRSALSREGGRAANRMRDEASAVVDGASRRAREAADYARNEAGTMANVFRDHPAASSGALITIGLLGGLLGYLLAAGSDRRNDYASSRHWFG